MPDSMSAPTVDPWQGIDPRLVQLYQSHGIMTPGAAGSGFTDANYWNTNAINNAGGDWNYVLNRLGSDLSGTGPDAPGPGDAGNKSGQQSGQFGQGLGGNILQLLQGILGGGMNGINPQGNSAPLYNPHLQNIGQSSVQNSMGNSAVNNANRATSSNGTLIGTTGMSQPTFMNQAPRTTAPSSVTNGKFSPFSSTGSMNSQNTPMGAPSFYQNGNPMSASQKNDSTSYTNQLG